jgi:hypothetical protein
LALASVTTNAKPYAIRSHFSHRKRSGIRRKRGFSGLFAVSGYRQAGFEAKIPQRSKALSEKPAPLERPNASLDRKLATGRGQKSHAMDPADRDFRAARAPSSTIVRAAPALTRSNVNMRARSGTDSPVIITAPGGWRGAICSTERNLFSAVFRQMRAARVSLTCRNVRLNRSHSRYWGRSSVG